MFEHNAISILFQGNNFLRLLKGLGVTLEISLFSALFSIPLGVLFGMFMRRNGMVSRVLSRLYLDFAVNFSGEVASVFVFVLWGTAEMGDLVRGAIDSIPGHQWESAKALGLSRGQTERYIILPQTVRRLIPLSMNLLTRMVKTTSLVVLIGVVEVLKVGQQIIDTNRFQYPTAALPIYGVIFFLYFLVCWPISIAARKLEKKWQ